MAICFARVRYVSRSTGGRACNSSAYNARSKIVDEKTGEVFNWSKREDNVYHEMLLPDYVDKKFKNISEFANEVEKSEKRKDSQLFEEWVLALPKEEEVTFDMKKELVLDYVHLKEWVKEGLGVQIDIHAPHDGEDNWHIHILRTTRRFRKDGLALEEKKAIDLKPEIKYGKVQKSGEIEHHLFWRNLQNEKYKSWGLDLRVDLPGKLTQEHIGPVRMRSVMNEAVHRNEMRKESNIEYLSSASRVLERVTNHTSVFNRKDLMRAVKIVPDREIREKLVEDALSSKLLINLYDEAGKDTGYYTTTEIRAEEEKILRLSGYVANQKNVVASNGSGMKRKSIQQLLVNSKSDFSEEQQKALSSLLFSESGIRILRGRAGTGKSHVLGKLGEIAEKGGVNVIGLAPTHKAKKELASRGYEQNDTVKGMLFKLHNGRFDLPKNSLLVVDEAGMIGNDDFKELLRVAASRNCNVILSMDEKQLTSVQRGGMGEVLAERYGSSSILNIKRQDNEWGRAVAMAFSNGVVSTGISILQAQNKLVEHGDKEQSMQSLLADWSKSEEKISDRLIIAVKNIDVAALNHGARQYLKLEGVLSGEEIAVGGSHYMKGDRILIKETNKDLGLINGDFATVMHASKERFVVSLEDVKDESDKPSDNSKIVEFAPSEYRGFRHGYATTVFKAQGASIRDVYVFHDGFAGIRNSYVALSRNVNNLHLYINNQATKSIPHLIKQLGHDPEIGSSLSYFSQKDLADRFIANAPKQHKGLVGSLVGGFVDYASRQLTGLVDKHMPDSEYYNYKAPELKREKVEEVLGYVAQEINEEFDKEIIVERAVVGGNSSGNIEVQGRGVSSTLNSNNTRQSSKERFYANADYIRSRVSHLDRKAEWDSDMERLRSEVKFKTESIARDLLGEPNKTLSNGRHLRFGEHGKISVGISGEKLGSWYDFSADKGGDMFVLVQDRQKCDFKESVEYLRRSVGMEAGNNSHLQLVHDHRNKDLTEKHIKAKAEEERINKAKAKQVDKLYSRAKDIGDRSMAYKYLTKERGLEFQVGLTHDVKTAGVYVGGGADESNTLEKGRYLPAIVAFARDSDGRVTGGQQILLNKISGAKAGVDIPKKSFGKIAGSFVDLDHLENKGENGKNSKNIIKPEITIIAEGLETALSVKQALREHNGKKGISTKTLCSLGISNIKNYQPNLGKKIIIAADNDGVSSLTNKTIENAKMLLEEKGAYVEIVRPAKEGDFNDVLKSDGIKAISEAFEPAITKHTAKTLTEYFTKDVIEEKLDKNDKANLVYIEKYDLSQETIINAYRKGELQGKLELEQTRKGLEQAAYHFNNNKEALKEVRSWGYKVSDEEITKSLIGMDERESSNHIKEVRNDYLSDYLQTNLKKFNEKEHTYDFDKLKGIVRAEQELLKATYKSLKSSATFQEYGKSYSLLESGKKALELPEMLDKLFKLSDFIKTNSMATTHEICRDLSSSNNLDSLINKAESTIERHYVYNIPEELAKERQQAVSIKSVFEGISKEQDALADLHGNIKIFDFDKQLIAKCELAKLQRDNNDLDALKYIVHQSLENGAKTKDELLKNLKQVTDLKVAHTQLDKDIEVHHINSTLEELKEDKQVSKTPDEVLNIITKEQEFLSGLHNNIKYPEHHSDELKKLINDAKENKEAGILNELEKALNANQKQAIKSDEELIGILRNPACALSEHCKHLHNIARNERHENLQWYSSQLNSLEKMGSKIDHDRLVNILNPMSAEDRKEYINSLTAAETAKYVEPLLAHHGEEKSKATNITELIKAVEKEQSTYVHLHNDHGMAIYALDKSNGNMKISVLASAANDLHNLGGIAHVQKAINHAIEHKIVTADKIYEDLKNNGSNMKMLSEDLHRNCHNHHRSVIDDHMSDLSKNRNVYIDNYTFKDPVSYLNYMKVNQNHCFMPIDHINKQLEHIQSQNELDMQKELNLNKNINHSI
jgi:Ti-type conjugative transfer relaxase TraA